MFAKGKSAKMLLTVILFFTGTLSSVHAQDILVLKSGREMKVIIDEETSDVIKYREYENASGPLYSIDKTKVESVKYSRKKPNTKEEKTDVNPVIDEVNAGDQTVTVKKRYVIQNGKNLSSRQVKTLFEDSPRALELYTKGHKQCASSNACAYGIVGICLAANLATNKMEDDKKMPILGSALAISGGLVITGIVLSSSGKKKIREAVSIYNAGITKPTSYLLDLKLSNRGIGVALRF